MQSCKRDATALLARFMLFLGGASIACATALPVHSQSAYPGRPIRLVVPFTPGSSTDTAARVIGEGMRMVAGTTVVVENRAGANGYIALTSLKQSPPDGYSVVYVGLGTMVTLPLIDPAISQMERVAKPIDEFRIAALGVTYDILFITGPSGPASMRELLDQIRSPTGNVKIPQISIGSPVDLANLYLVRLAGGKATSVPYKGGSQTTADHINGLLTFGAETPPVIPLVKSGKLRGLAVMSRKRFAELPDVPTLEETGLAQMANASDWRNWTGFYVVRSTPDVIVEKLNELIRKAMLSPEVAERMKKIEQLPAGLVSAKEAQAYWEGENRRWRPILATIGMLAADQ